MLSRFNKMLVIGASVAALSAGTAVLLKPSGGIIGSAWAEGSQGSGQGSGDHGSGGQGAGGNSDQGGAGQGGPGPDSEGKGPKAGAQGASGGKPVWAQEGIPEVELGRLNVARSPSKVLDQALAEALATLSPEMIEFYNQDLASIIEALSLSFDEQTYIDSPLQNLSLLKDVLDGTSVLADLGVTTDAATLEAVFLGVASDKTVPISAETVEAVTTILGDPITGAEAEALAAAAESVRIAVLAGHG